MSFPNFIGRLITLLCTPLSIYFIVQWIRDFIIFIRKFFED